jgi:hypothetical protein
MTGQMKIGRENRSSRRNTCPFPLFSPENPAGTYVGLNPDLRHEKVTIICLTYGTVHEPE